MNTWHNRITEIRTEAGLNKTEFANRVGVSTATVTDWESGKIKSLSAETLLSICNQVNVSPYWVINGQAPKKVGDTATKDMPVVELLDELTIKLRRSDPVIRQEIIGLIVRYLDKDDAKSSIGRAIELLTEDSL